MKRWLAFVTLWMVVVLVALPAGAQSGPLAIPTIFGNPRIEFSPDGGQMAVFEDANYAWAMEITPTEDARTVMLYDPATGDHLTSLAGASDFLASLVFTPDGTQVIGLAANGEVLTWDAASGELVATARTPLLNPRAPLFWHPQTGELVVALPNLSHTSYASLDPTTGALTFLTHNLPITTYTDWMDSQEERGPRAYNDLIVVPAPHSEALAGLPLAGDEVWTANPQGQVALLSLGTGEAQILREGDEYPMFNVNDIVATPSGLVGYTVGNEDTLFIFDLVSGEETEIAVEHRSALLSPDGRQIAQYNADETGLLLSAVDGSKTSELAFPEGLSAGPRAFLRVRFSPDGARLVATGLKDADDQSVIAVFGS